MQTLAEIKALLAAHGLWPRYEFGQNFLIDHNLLTKLVDAAELSPGNTVLEIGPGTGTLTEELLARGCRVVATEIDHGMCALLRARFAAQPRFTLIEGDCLAGKRSLAPEVLAALGDDDFKLVSNLPYNAATPVMMTLIAEAHFEVRHVSRRPRPPANALPGPECNGQFVTIQREVADRLLAKPGTKNYGPLAVLATVATEVNLLATLSPECFWPRPEVRSAMVSIIPQPGLLTYDLRGLVNFTQSLFAQRRKQLGSILGRERTWPAGIAPTDRAETLTVTQLLALQRAVADDLRQDAP